MITSLADPAWGDISPPEGLFNRDHSGLGLAYDVSMLCPCYVCGSSGPHTNSVVCCSDCLGPVCNPCWLTGQGNRRCCRLDVPPDL